MRVTHVISGLGSGGAEGFLARLVPHLADRVDSTVISLRDEGVHGAALRNQTTAVHSIGLERGPADLRRIAALVGQVRRSDPDLVQTWLYHGDLLGGTVGRLLRLPVVWNVRQTLVTSGPQPHRRLIELSARLSRLVPAAIVAVSDSARDDHVAAGYDRARFEVIPNGFDTGRYRPDPTAGTSLRRELGLGPGVPLVGLVARDDPQKDHTTAFLALARLRVRHPDAHLILCGQGMERANAPLVARIRSHGIDGACSLLGERRDLPRIQAALDVALSTSAYGEGLNNAIGEALASEVPAIVTSVGDTARMVAGAGLVVAPGDPELVAEAIGSILEMTDDDRRTCGIAARRRIVDVYDLDSAANGYFDLYRRVLCR